MGVKSKQLQIRMTPQQKSALKRLAQSAGQDLTSYVLSRVLPEHQARFARILHALGEGLDHRFALAELNDYLTGLAPMEFPDAVAHANLGGLSPFTRNYVAAMVEQAASQKEAPAPPWVQDIPPLDEPYFAARLPSLRLHLLRASPVPFKRRNIFIDAGVGARV